MSMVLLGTPCAEWVEGFMARYVVISYHDDIAVLLNSADPNDYAVRCVDVKYPPDAAATELTQIASSSDEYLAESLTHFTKTLDTEIYWW